MRAFEQFAFTLSQAINTYLNGHFARMFRVDRLWQSLVVFLIFGIVALFTAPVWSGKNHERELPNVICYCSASLRRTVLCSPAHFQQGLPF